MKSGVAPCFTQSGNTVTALRQAGSGRPDRAGEGHTPQDGAQTGGEETNVEEGAAIARVGRARRGRDRGGDHRRVIPVIGPALRPHPRTILANAAAGPRGGIAGALIALGVPERRAVYGRRSRPDGMSSPSSADRATTPAHPHPHGG